MSVVIEFRARSTPSSRPDTGARGEVVIFPGVRIERRDANPADRITKVTRAGYRSPVEASAWSTFLTQVVPLRDAGGRIVRSGGPELALELEREGYGAIAA